MIILAPGEQRDPVVRPVPVGPGRLRKIGLIGGAPESLLCAPWQDPSWEFWCHASVTMAVPKGLVARFFDLHPKLCFTEEQKHGFANYYQFLKRCPTPIYMQEQYVEIPASVKYPLDLVVQQWPDTPFGSLTAYMVGLALLEGVTHLGFFGIDYAHDSEYEEQRANAEHWVGIAKGMGVHVIIPKVSPLCHTPLLRYGYETHTPELYTQRKQRVVKYRKQEGPQGGPFQASRLQAADPITAEQAAEIRRTKDPAWTKAMAKMGDEMMPASMESLASMKGSHGVRVPAVPKDVVPGRPAVRRRRGRAGTRRPR